MQAGATLAPACDSRRRLCQRRIELCWRGIQARAGRSVIVMLTRAQERPHDANARRRNAVMGLCHGTAGMRRAPPEFQAEEGGQEGGWRARRRRRGEAQPDTDPERREEGSQRRRGVTRCLVPTSTRTVVPSWQPRVPRGTARGGSPGGAGAAGRDVAPRPGRPPPPPPNTPRYAWRCQGRGRPSVFMAQRKKTFIYMYRDICILQYMHTHIYIYICVCLCMYIYTYTNIHMHFYVNVCISFLRYQL